MKKAAAVVVKVSTSEDTAYQLRLSTYDDIPALRFIEREAAKRFHDVGLERVADDEPLEAQDHAMAIEDGLSFAIVYDDEPVGFLAAEWMDDALHIAEISIHPDHSGRRLGQVLINAAKGVCAEKGAKHVSLSTFRDVPWNAPYYEKLGFIVVEAEALGPQHLQMKQAQDVVFDQTPRVFMALGVD